MWTREGTRREKLRVRGRARRNARRAGPLLAALVALPLLGAPLLGVDARANDINDILNGTVEAAPDPVAPAQPAPPSVAPPAAAPGATTPGTAAAPPRERWLSSEAPLDHLSVITVHPLPSENCQDVLFEIRPTKRVRHAPRAGGSLRLDLGNLCLIGLRNESDDRTLLLRVGEELRTVAITSDSRLYSGMAIGPGQEVQAPIRPLPVDRLRIAVEAVWDDRRGDDEARVDRFDVEIVSAPPA